MSYFSGSSAEVNTPATWTVPEDLEPLSMGTGITFRPSVGKNLLVNLVRMEPGAHPARHNHDEEQASYVLEGVMEIEVSGERRRVGPGELVIIPANAPHEVWVPEGTTTVIDIFAPPRQALLDILAAHQQEG
ncbi:MAG: cupin domain-containing protein [Candidatus Dormibacteraeota bacterium]|nr:cupin domain-containing protein [Candidatus Dormibacteraeota bacterium]MBO0746330.1 cupin domain-containing protein [Candidatus Dormibacteraeota bacterium]